MDLAGYAGLPLSRETLRSATDDIMTAIADLLGELRGEDPPAERYDHHRVLEERRAAAALKAAVPEAPPSGRRPGPDRSRVRRRAEGGRLVTFRTAVMGAGSWGTTFKLLHDAGGEVVLWGRRPEVVEAVNERHENPDYLPGVTLPEGVRATLDPAEALKGADFVALAVPAQTLRQNLRGWLPHLPPDAVLVSLMKGVEIGTSLRMSEVVCEVAGIARERVGVFCGPTSPGRSPAESPARRSPPAWTSPSRSACRLRR